VTKLTPLQTAAAIAAIVSATVGLLGLIKWNNARVTQSGVGNLQGDVTASPNSIAVGQGGTVNVLNPPLVLSEPPPCDDLFAATFTRFPPGYVPPETPFGDYDVPRLKHRITIVGDQLGTYESMYQSEIKSIMASPQDDSASQEQRRAQIKNINEKKTKADDEWTRRFQTEQLPEIRSLHDELIRRLKLPFPVCSNSGLSVGGYKALMQGFISDHGSLSNLADSLANKLPPS
jgi:hypothetical protein